MENVVRVNQRGTVTIPAKIRRKYGLRKGSKVVILEIDEGIFLLNPKLSSVKSQYALITNAVLRRSPPKGWDSTKLIRYWRDRRYKF